MPILPVLLVSFFSGSLLKPVSVHAVFHMGIVNRTLNLPSRHRGVILLF
jgi:hypothetical protein